MIFYGITPEESYNLLLEMQDFRKAQQADDLMEEHMKQMCSTVFETCKDFWLSAIDEYVDETNAKIRNFYCEFAKNRYEELNRKNVPFEERLFPFCAYALHAEVLNGEISWDTTLERLYKHYQDNYVKYFDNSGETNESQVREDIEKQNILCGINEHQEVMNSLLETVIIMERWSRNCTNSNLARMVRERLIADIPKFYHFYTNVTLEISQELTKLCFAFLPDLKTAEEKERWILELVTKKQFATHLHSVMVQKIAVTVATSLHKTRPELFDNVKEQIGDKDLMEFISKCALFHDVGKNDIATIVNVQARALDDMEFAAIKKHPYFGYHRFLEDPDFSCYKDVVLFHHKTYDGKGGYPLDADNTTSPYKIIADLITLCDCFDAGTDTLGRNYKRAKTVEELVTELCQDAGTKYNPDIVLHIKNTPELQQELKRLIVDERLDTAYEIACEYR